MTAGVADPGAATPETLGGGAALGSGEAAANAAGLLDRALAGDWASSS
jgi:hypothetical protein